MPNWLKKLYARIENWFYTDGTWVEYLIFCLICLLFALYLLNKSPYHLGWLIGS